MTLSLKRLFTGQLGTSVTTFYTAPTTTRINDASIVNTSASAVTLTLWAPTGGGEGSQNIIESATSIDAGETMDVASLRGRVLEAGFTISGLAGTAGALTLVIDGVEIT